MKNYFSIEKKTVTETVIKKSVFIAAAAPIKNAEDAELFIDAVRREHRGAAHNCYAYIVGENEMRFSDDGEPQGTAGTPMLTVLKKKGLEKIAVVVTRYFGGIKLGAPGLISAYAVAVLNCIEAAGIKKYVPFRSARLRFGYAAIRIVDGVLKGFSAVMENAEYGEDIRYETAVENEKYGAFVNALKERAGGAVEIEHGSVKPRAI
ncbi:MAG: IMPACT family protein [Clostridiales bacterium]|jgi:uncharacterized YigZ family protein|nr:IMPACT family protein [Clostridiales bacterium]